MKKLTFRIIEITKLVVACWFAIISVACSSSGGDGESSCGLVAASTSNPTAYFNVKNSLGGGLSWQFSNGIPFGADMKPGECTSFGLSPGGYSVSLQQCNISNEACTFNFGPVREEVFTVQSNETYTVTVTASYFQ